PAAGPSSAIEPIWSAALPVLVRVRDWETPGLPIGTEPKLRLSGLASRLIEKLTVGAVPVPVRAIRCGEPAALSLRTRVALRAPAAVGRNRSLEAPLSPGASVLPVGSAESVKSLGLAPVRLTP